MATGDVRLGLSGQFCYGSEGSPATTVSENVDDVSLKLSKRAAEWVRRGRKWVGFKPTVKEVSVEFKVLDVEGDALLAALESAWINDTRIALYPKNASSGKGLDADFYVMDFNRDEDNEEVIQFSVVCRPTDELRQPQYH